MPLEFTTTVAESLSLWQSQRSQDSVYPYQAYIRFPRLGIGRALFQVLLIRHHCQRLARVFLAILGNDLNILDHVLLSSRCPYHGQRVEDRALRIPDGARSWGRGYTARQMTGHGLGSFQRISIKLIGICYMRRWWWVLPTTANGLLK